MDEDRRLIERFLAGDGAAAATLEGWIRSAAFPYRHLVGEDWDDGIQESLIKVLENLRDDRFDGRSSLKTYVWRLTSYRFIDRLRRRRQQVDLDDVELVDREGDPADLALRRERWRMAARVLEKSSEACRQLWRLLLSGLGYRQIGEQLGVAAGTLRVRMLRCRDKALELRQRSERA